MDFLNPAGNINSYAQRLLEVSGDCGLNDDDLTLLTSVLDSADDDLKLLINILTLAEKDEVSADNLKACVMVLEQSDELIGNTFILARYVIDSADSERVWVLFQTADPKGSAIRK